MNIVSVPAICKKCDKAFFITSSPTQMVANNSPITIHEQVLPNNCIDKRCGGDALIPSGIYEWYGKQIRLIDGPTFTWEVIKKLTEALKNELVLYRYMDKEFIDKFKQDGTLRICLMAKYQTINDIRKDESEGIQISKLKGHGELTGEQAKEILGIEVKSIKFEPGWNKTLTHNNILPPAYVFCTSTVKSKTIMQRFKCNDYFSIHDIPEFKKALERAISESFEIQHGLDKHVEYKTDKSKDHKINKVVEDNVNLMEVDAMSFFQKTNLYSIESEYRFVYLVKSEDPPKEIFIKLTEEEINTTCTFHEIADGILTANIGRNDLCPCGSNKKYKKCHGNNI